MGGLKGETVHFFNFPGFWFLQGQYSHLALLAAFDCIDDTKLVKQIIISVSNSHSLEFKLKWYIICGCVSVTSHIYVSTLNYALWQYFAIYLLS